MSEQSPSKKPVFKYILWALGALVLVLLLTWAVMDFIVHPKEDGANHNGYNQPGPANDGKQGYDPNKQGNGQDNGYDPNKQGNDPNKKGGADPSKGKDFLSLTNPFNTNYGACPADVSGILTAPLMDPKYIGAMLPLGNVSPPGHTFPVDHIYFTVNSDDQIPLYAPADGWITHIMANSAKKTTDSPYVFSDFVVTYTICDGLVLDFAGYTDLVQPLMDELAKHTDSCKGGIIKSGHNNAGEQQCDYQNLSIAVKSGELVGHTHRDLRPDGGYNIPFEIWAANYNQPARSDVDWSFYDDNRYAHAVCTFDLYSGELKQQFDAKFGNWSDRVKDPSTGKMIPGKGNFTPRTVQPVCGQINQDIPGTLQGAWFSAKPNQNDKSGSVGWSGFGVTFIHYNVDPTVGELVVGGEFDKQLTGVINFSPTHQGTINREPSELKPDGQVYCYQADPSVMNTGERIDGKILVHMLDERHIEADHQPGSCGEGEALKQVFKFER